MGGIIFWNCKCFFFPVRNLEKAWSCERSVLGTYLGVLERMAANILDSWSEEEVIDPAHLATPPSSASTSLGKPEATCYLAR